MSPRFPLRPALLAAALALAAAAAHAGEAEHWKDARQMVVVVVDGWNAGHGTLQPFVREGDHWASAGAPAPVTIGRNGAAWGLGLNAAHPAGGPVKREGDNRSPAGVFRIGEAFGYAPRLDTAMPYRALGASDWCVDVSGAPDYNRIVDARVVGEAAVKGATEPMRRDLHFHGDQRYRMGFVIEHNAQQAPGGGSCIFGHLWKSPHDATAGCTAMTPDTMRRLLGWLKPEEHPVFVLLPRAAYAALRADWRLPALDASR
ncbi:L,D-transpeptidase family protein [Fulvimonas soli]|jgi:L,D-peptidoglycan transpeptidase YkuD (ErfK/YbiS/YcfS/YnhG family)|uniref:L,D-peptidoglycan transpeptidase YkuD (ErfK/YbiS/YcfS/YnhG family) n=1 Tax=Fulvimonas soli TaxID=155197 RepID=A0A316HRY6_9GAMM|nr:L,D-transpeptidase family protein [Fulvimonas soli]PWK82746.1 L,D-peptidoglycan transpeptidase YkuD (ErfK/YbiS/YcfS/YnhG family) [Fulvimonas soli]TNY26638.1 hypothetical protein BV497_07625 [Fulvimonas soli]